MKILSLSTRTDGVTIKKRSPCPPDESKKALKGRPSCHQEESMVLSRKGLIVLEEDRW
jgi:hypothetical protein